MNLTLTESELLKLINSHEPEERFKVIYDDIPKDGPSSQYIEDDGRQLRNFEFEDLTNGETYNIYYVWEPDWKTEMCSLNHLDERITLIDDPVIPVEVPPKVKLNESIEAVTDRKLWEAYLLERAANKIINPVASIPAKKLKQMVAEIKEHVAEKRLTMYNLRGIVIPACIEHGVDDKDLWRHLQKKI